MPASVKPDERNRPKLASSSVVASSVPPRRLPPAERRRQIVEAAAAYFAQVGFDAPTRGLADRLGITEPLIYRYFATKDALIRAVYDAVYEGPWQADWRRIVCAREVPLRERLITFYESFAEVVFEPAWMRLYLFSGLRGLDINRWWIGFVEKHVLSPLCAELRQDAGLPSPADEPVRPSELELYWLFHGGIFYWGMRRHLYGLEPRLEFRAFLTLSVDTFLAGYRATAPGLLGAERERAA